MEKDLERVSKQIEEKDAEIKQVATAIAAAEAEWRKGGPDKGHWEEEKRQLRLDKGRLQDEKYQLRELMLRLTPPAAAVRRGPDADAGPSTDVEMQDADPGNQNFVGPSGSGGPSGRGQLRGDHLRSSGDNPWSSGVDKEVHKVLEHAFVSPERNGQPQLDLRPPSSNNPLARADASAVYFRGSPSLLLTSLPGMNELGLTNAQKLLAENKELHALGHGQDQVQTRVTTLIGPSGAGKTRTALEALCHEYGFYMSFSTEKEPGTILLREAVQRLKRKHKDEYKAAKGDAARLEEFRDDRLDDMAKFISRILLAYALGLLEYLRQHGEQASPKGFLLFQLIGIAAGQEDWLVSTWDCLLSLSGAAVEEKLVDTMAQLRTRTKQDFFNIFLDEAQVGTHELDGYFPSRDKTQGRPLLNGWLRSLYQRIFAPFHFNLTGTGLSLRHAQQLETATAEVGAAQLKTFTDFTRFSMDDALEYAQEYLLRPPNGIKGHILMGRPRFATQLVQVVLRDEKGWGEALEYLEHFHTEAMEPTSLQWGLHEKKNLPGDLFRRLQRQLVVLVQGYYLVGRGVATNNADVDMIQVGVCHLDELGPMGECTKVALVEPLAAMAVKSFIATEYDRHLDEMHLDLLRLTPTDSATGAVFELLIPRAQQHFVTSIEGSCLAHHPLLRDIKGLPVCFKKPARMEGLYGHGESNYFVDDYPRVQAWRRGRGLLEFLRDPAGVPSFFPEEGAGPDNVSFVQIGGERWISFVQAKCRKKVPNKAHALGTLNIRTMYKGDRSCENKRKQLKSVLQQRGVRGILQVLLAYPAEVDVGSFAKSTLRRSPRFQPQEENDFDFVQVCVSRANAQSYLTADLRNHLDCIKDV